MSSFPVEPQSERNERLGPADHADDSALYAEWATRLRRVVSGCVNTSDANVDDACSFAWMQLLRRQPRRETAFAWMVTVAKREAWRLDANGRCEARDTGGDLADRVPDVRDIAGNRDALRSALDAVERLHPRRRQMLMEHASGYTFDEIAARHGINRSRACALVYKARRQLAEMLADPDA